MVPFLPAWFPSMPFRISLFILPDEAWSWLVSQFIHRMLLRAKKASQNLLDLGLN